MLANIVADVIIPLAPQVPGLLEEDGVFLCSGIIDTRAHEVESALKKAGLTLAKRRGKGPDARSIGGRCQRRLGIPASGTVFPGAASGPPFFKCDGSHKKTGLPVDIDPKAVDVAYENAALNGIGRDRYTVRAVLLPPLEHPQAVPLQGGLYLVRTGVDDAGAHISWMTRSLTES